VRRCRVGAAEGDAAVAAGVGEDADLAMLVANDDHGVHAEPSQNVVAGLRDLALMREEEPRAPEDPLLLGHEYWRDPSRLDA